MDESGPVGGAGEGGPGPVRGNRVAETAVAVDTAKRPPIGEVPAVSPSGVFIGDRDRPFGDFGVGHLHHQYLIIVVNVGHYGRAAGAVGAVVAGFAPEGGTYERSGGTSSDATRPWRTTGTTPPGAPAYGRRVVRQLLLPQVVAGVLVVLGDTFAHLLEPIGVGLCLLIGTRLQAQSVKAVCCSLVTRLAAATR